MDEAVGMESLHCRQGARSVDLKRVSQLAVVKLVA